MHCNRRRLLRRGLEFHVCTINKSAHTKKVSKLIVCTSYIYIYVCMYVYIYVCVYICTYVYMYACIYIYIYMCVCVCVCVCECVCVCVIMNDLLINRICICKILRIYIYIYIYIYICVCVCVCIIMSWTKQNLYLLSLIESKKFLSAYIDFNYTFNSSVFIYVNKNIVIFFRTYLFTYLYRLQKILNAFSW